MLEFEVLFVRCNSSGLGWGGEGLQSDSMLFARMFVVVRFFLSTYVVEEVLKSKEKVV